MKEGTEYERISFLIESKKPCLPDINECEAKENPCEGQPGKRCVNTKGGYICCDAGIDDERCIKGHFCFINSAKRLFLAFFLHILWALGIQGLLSLGYMILLVIMNDTIKNFQTKARFVRAAVV